MSQLWWIHLPPIHLVSSTLGEQSTPGAVNNHNTTTSNHGNLQLLCPDVTLLSPAELLFEWLSYWTEKRAPVTSTWGISCSCLCDCDIPVLTTATTGMKSSWPIYELNTVQVSKTSIILWLSELLHLKLGWWSDNYLLVVRCYRPRDVILWTFYTNQFNRLTNV